MPDFAARTPRFPGRSFWPKDLGVNFAAWQKRGQRPLAPPTPENAGLQRPIAKNSSFARIEAMFTSRFESPKKAVIAPMSQMSASLKPWAWSAA